MNMDLAIPDQAVKYILFQRTGHLVLERRKLFRLLNKYSPLPAFNMAVKLEALIRKHDVKQSFVEDIRHEYEDIKPWLPKQCGRVLDIGCGVAGIDALLHRHYGDDGHLVFELLDKTDTERKVYYGFRERGAFYNSLNVAEELLTGNGVPRQNIRAMEVGADGRIDAEPGLDLVISLISWGYHYAVGTYLSQVVRLLRPGGCLIMDVRKGTDGLEELAPKFETLTSISTTPGRTRVLAIKAAA